MHVCSNKSSMLTLTVTIALFYLTTFASALPSTLSSPPSNKFAKRANASNGTTVDSPLPCDGADSRYDLVLLEPKPGARTLPRGARHLIRVFVQYLSEQPGDLSHNAFRLVGSLVIDIGSKPYEPYPPGAGDAVGMEKRGWGEARLEERDGEEEKKGQVAGQPVPLYIKNTDVANCLDRLRLYVELIGSVREIEMQIKDNPTGRVVADGELKIHD